MSNANTYIADSASDATPRGFEQMLYWFSADQKDFDADQFRRALPSGADEMRDPVLFFAPRAGENGAYHAVFGWTITESKVNFQLQYDRGPRKHAADESEPYAEDAMHWLGRFFQTPEVPCHTHARFKHPLDERDTCFPLALSTPPPCDATISGVALRLPTKPHGASTVRITRGAKNWYAEVIGNGTINFATYTLFRDVTTAATVLELFLQETGR